MKISITLLCLAFCASTYAQPVLTTGQLPQAGDVLVQDWMNTAPNQIPNEGANVTWDLSQTTFNSLEDSGVYLNLTTTVPGWNYNLAFQYYSGTQPKFDFYELYSGEMRYAGYARADQAFDTLILNNSSLFLTVPITFGGNFTQPLSGQYVNNGGNIPITGTTFLDADAYGTLILPWASYTNVLRVHVRDSLNVFGFPQINDSYYYYSTMENHPLMVIQQKNPPTGYAIKPGIPLGINHQGLERKLKVFPNPATDRVFVELPSGNDQMQVALLDLQGKMVKSLEIPSQQPGLLILETGNFPRGMYMLRVKVVGENVVVNRKIVLQ